MITNEEMFEMSTKAFSWLTPPQQRSALAYFGADAIKMDADGTEWNIERSFADAILLVIREKRL